MVSVRQPASKTTPEAIEGEIISESPAQEFAWLRLSSQAPLPVAACLNYLRYGPGGVRRYGPGSPPPPPLDNRELSLSLRLKAASGQVRWETESLRLTLAAADFEGRNLWQGASPAARLVLRWTWDFYRLHSQLEILLAKDSPASPEYTAALEALGALRAGDQAVVFVAGRAGDILTVYPIEGPAT